MERQRLVDLLPDRSAETLREWLRAHPEVEIIRRDRADDYIKGATEGAPRAVQVADRWRLLRNLGDCMRRVVDRLGSGLRQALAAFQQAVAIQARRKPPATATPVDSAQESPKATRYSQRQHGAPAADALATTS